MPNQRAACATHVGFLLAVRTFSVQASGHLEASQANRSIIQTVCRSAVTPVTTSKALVTTSFLVTTSKAPVTTSKALVTTSFLVTTSKAPVTTSKAPVTTSKALVTTSSPY